MATNGAYEGTELIWCEERTESLGLDVEGETFELEHICGKGEDHDGPHKCLWCPQTWDMEVPC